MPCVTSNERIARWEGWKEGLGLGQLEAVQEALVDVPEARFGQPAVGLMEKMQGCNELVRLKNALRQAALVDSLEKLELPPQDAVVRRDVDLFCAGLIAERGAGDK